MKKMNQPADEDETDMKKFNELSVRDFNSNGDKLREKSMSRS